MRAPQLHTIRQAIFSFFVGPYSERIKCEPVKTSATTENAVYLAEYGMCRNSRQQIVRAVGSGKAITQHILGKSPGFDKLAGLYL